MPHKLLAIRCAGRVDARREQLSDLADSCEAVVDKLVALPLETLAEVRQEIWSSSKSDLLCSQGQSAFPAIMVADCTLVPTKMYRRTGGVLSVRISPANSTNMHNAIQNSWPLQEVCGSSIAWTSKVGAFFSRPGSPGLSADIWTCWMKPATTTGLAPDGSTEVASGVVAASGRFEHSALRPAAHE